MTLEEAGRYAAMFRSMADAIEHNHNAAFGGACVILPPGAEEPISVLVFDSTQDSAANFFKVLSDRIRAKMEEADKKAHQLQGFGMR